MSMPKIPDLTPDICITRENAVNVIIASVAMEELALAHILNAEGEKLQYVLGTLKEDEGDPGNEITLCDIMAVNDSIHKTLRDVIKAEMLLGFKLEDAIELVESGSENECRLTIKGQKIWIDGDNIYKTRPENVVISLLRNGTAIDTCTVSSKGDGRFTFACLPILDSFGEKYTYTIDEVIVPKGYKKTINGYNVINTAEPGSLTIEGTKTWDDEQSVDRPGTITVNLLQNDVLTPLHTITVTTPDDADTVPFSFQPVPQFDNEGKPFVYTVTEVAVPSYKTEIKGYNITNTHD